MPGRSRGENVAAWAQNVHQSGDFFPLNRTNGGILWLRSKNADARSQDPVRADMACLRGALRMQDGGAAGADAARDAASDRAGAIDAATAPDGDGDGDDADLADGPGLAGRDVSSTADAIAPTDVPASETSPPDADRADGGVPSLVLYRAVTIVGGINRLVITKWDVRRRLCFRLQLASAWNPSALPLELPGRWGVERAGVTTDAATCDVPYPPPRPATNASGGSGYVRWMGLRPCVIDLDVELVFDPAAPGVPARERLTSSGLTPPGC